MIKKIKNKILFITSITILLMFLINRNYIQFRDALVANEQANLSIIADTVSKSIQNYFTLERESIEKLIKDPLFIKGFKDIDLGRRNEIDESIKVYYNTGFPRVENIKIYNTKERILTSYPNRTAKISDFEKKEIQWVLKESTFRISEAVFEGDSSFIYLSAPITENGSVIGVIQNKLSIRYIYNNFVEHIKIGKSGYASIKDNNQVFLMHPNKSQIGNNVLELRKKRIPDYDWEELKVLLSRQANKEKGTMIYHSLWSSNKETKLVKKFNSFSYITLQDKFWIVTVVNDYDDVVSNIRKNFYINIFIAISIVISILYLLFYIFLTKENERKLEEKIKYSDNLEKLNNELKTQIEENKKNQLLMIHQSRHAAMGEMIENIAHQWRQPLNTLAIITTNLKDSFVYNDLSREDVEGLFSKSNIIIKNMSDTIDEFRDFFKPKSSKEKFYLEDIIRLTMDICQERIKNNKIDISYHNTEDIEIHGYINQLSQVTINIFNNAIDALLESDTEDKAIRVLAESVGEDLSIIIENNGKAIPSEIQKKIFEPYFSTKNKKNGTGIGLYMSKIIINNNFNGNISVTSDKVKTQFKIIIPRE